MAVETKNIFTILLFVTFFIFNILRVIYFSHDIPLCKSSINLTTDCFLFTSLQCLYDIFKIYNFLLRNNITPSSL
jgi:hypothetical protein